MRALAAAAFVLLLGLSAARAATDIDLFFPVPVQGKLAAEMTRLVDRFNKEHADIAVTAVYTGSYDDTNLKTHAAIQAGRPPAAVIMSANFVREYVIGDEIVAFDDLIRKDGQTPAGFMDQFWPALRPNATDQGHVYGVPFQNSTPLLYYSEAAFRDAGLDPSHPPATWAEWVEDAKRITRHDAAQTTRWGVMMPGTYDYLGWITSGLAMSNGGQFYNPDYGGEVYYTEPSTIGAVQFLDDLVHKHKVMPEGVTDANAVTTAFFQGRTGMMILSTGSLGFVRDNMKQPYHTAFLPKKPVQRGADRRRQPDLAEGQHARTHRSSMDAHQVAQQPRDRRQLESFHWILRAPHRRLRPAGDERLPRRTPGREGRTRPARLRARLVRHLQHGGRAQGAGGRRAIGPVRQGQAPRCDGGGPAQRGRADAPVRGADRAQAAGMTLTPALSRRESEQKKPSPSGRGLGEE